MANVMPDDPKTAWFHENTLVVRNNEAILDEVPITVRGGEKSYSASDGGFFTYRARFAEEQGKPIVTMRLCNADYAIFVMGKDPYAELKSYPVKTTPRGIEFHGVMYKPTALRKDQLDRLLDMLARVPLEKPPSQRRSVP